MKAMILDEYGNDAEFRLRELPRPEAKAGHVLVRVAASSVNTVDTMIRQMGKALPFRPTCPPCWAWTSPAPWRLWARA